MGFVKRGTFSSDSSEIIVSESVYLCSSCGHTDVFRAKDLEEGKDQACSQCGEPMHVISNSSQPEDNEDKEDTSEDSEDSEETQDSEDSEEK